MLNFTMQLATNASDVSQASQNAPSLIEALSSMWILPVMLIALYFIMIRPQKKRQKQEEEMRRNIQIGDNITTIGGIVGKVVNLREDSLIIETGADRSKLRVKRWSVQSVDTIHDTDSSK